MFSGVTVLIFFFRLLEKKQLGFQKHVSDMAYKHDQI